jgi:hypothetical protein
VLGGRAIGVEGLHYLYHLGRCIRKRQGI